MQRPEGLLYDPGDAVLVESRNWYLFAGNYVRTGTAVNGNRLLSRILLAAPTGVEVDHINRDPLDNRRCNLRFATRQEQGLNRGPFANSTTGYKGVSLHCGRYQASIRLDGRLVYLGRFDTAAEAHASYLAALGFWRRASVLHK